MKLHLTRVMFVAVAGLTFGGVRAGQLATQSPFLPAAGNAPLQDGALAADHVELRGIMTGPGGNLFYLFDPAKKRGSWVGAEETDEAFSIVAWDADKETLELRSSHGELLHLRMRSSKTLAAGFTSGSSIAPSAGETERDLAAPETHEDVQRAWREEFKRRQAENAASN